MCFFFVSRGLGGTQGPQGSPGESKYKGPNGETGPRSVINASTGVGYDVETAHVLLINR